MEHPGHYNKHKNNNQKILQDKKQLNTTKKKLWLGNNSMCFKIQFVKQNRKKQYMFILCYIFFFYACFTVL